MPGSNAIVVTTYSLCWQGNGKGERLRETCLDSLRGLKISKDGYSTVHKYDVGVVE